MELESLIEKIFECVENDKTHGAVMACLRVARRQKDYLNIAIFLQELMSDHKSAIREFFKDTTTLTEEKQKHIWDLASKIVTDEHDFGKKGDPNELTVLISGVEEIDSYIAQIERNISDRDTPAGMTPFDTAAFHASNTEMKTKLRNRIIDILTVKMRIKARCFNYATEMEKQILVQLKQKSFVFDLQSVVNNYFKESNEVVYKRLITASGYCDSTNTEHHSLLLTETRRVLAAVADHFYPAKEGLIKCHDGKERVLGANEYLNRIEEFIYTDLQNSTARDLLRAEFDVLTVFARRINKTASKGVHENVNSDEAKQGLLGLYVFLFNLIRKLQSKES